MNRREALAATATLLGVTITGAQIFLSGCTPAEKNIGSLNDIDSDLLDEIGDTILPESASSPGAKAARIGAFMKTIVADCYSEIEQKTFVDGVNKLIALCRETYRDSFLNLSADKKLELLTKLDHEASAFNQSKKEEEPDHYFSMVKQLTLWGYFTSEPGATQALRYVPIPGRYDGCVDYTGEPAWLY
ncbi:MAG: gluconate 2-dehydrogenase subunit 3 family protein [Cyclobacteriaceae bacterium]|nr:gluconate 2-dehydrogenase subunit 3 family protein [Cyclobacteriaceae bacterium]